MSDDNDPLVLMKGNGNPVRSHKFTTDWLSKKSELESSEFQLVNDLPGRKSLAYIKSCVS